MTNSGSQMVLGSNNGWSGMMTAQNLQPAPGSNPFLNLGAQPTAAQLFGQVTSTAVFFFNTNNKDNAYK